MKDGKIDAWEAARAGIALDNIDGGRNGLPPERKDLEIISFLPIVGTPADIALALADLSEGNAEAAVWDVIGLVPIEGDARQICRKADTSSVQ